MNTVESYAAHRFVGLLSRSLKSVRTSGDCQHAATIGTENSLLARSPCMKDHYAFEQFCFVESRNRFPFFKLARVAT